MFVRTWIDFLRSHLSRPPTRRSKRAADRRVIPRRLLLEGLEDRRLLAFDLAVDYPTGASPQAVITADFNNDGRLDVATANSETSNVSVLLGNGDGTLQPAQNSATGILPLSLAVGDFNADGKLDLATANAYDVNVMLGNGNGSFLAPTNIDIGTSPASVAVGDFNGDGKLDLGVTSNTYSPPYNGGYYSSPGSYSGYASVLLGTGAGSFAAPVTSFLDFGYHTSAAVADFNGDGKQDFATVNAQYGYVSVLLGNSTGLGAATRFTTGATPRAVTVGDFTGDGILDVAASGVLRGNGNGSFQWVSQTSGPNALAPADFNGDGILDLAWVDTSSTAAIKLGTGGGAFRVPIAVAANVTGVAVGDFNGDGDIDLATANISAGTASVLFNDGDWPPVDAPVIFINDVTVTEGNTGTLSAQFLVTLSAPYAQPITIHYATADGSATVAGGDYEAVSDTLTFTPGGPLTQNITVLINGDRLGEYGETFTVNLSDPTGFFIADPTAVGIINDDEPFIDIIEYIQIAEGHTGTTLVTFTVTLHEAYDVPVSVDYTTADLTPDEQYLYNGPTATASVDYVATAGTLTIPAGQLTGTITVPVIGDRVGEGYELFFVKLTNANFAKINYSPVLAEIVDDEPSVGIYSSTSTPEGNSGTTPKTFTVVLSARYDVDIPVSYATSDGSAVAGSDYVATTGTVIIPAGQLTQSITVLVIGDLLTESIEHFYVTLTGATGAAVSGFDSALIIDDDTPPTIRVGDTSVIEGNSGTKLMTITVSLSQASGQGVSVNYATANGSATTSNIDYVAKSGSIYFAPGETSKTITVTIKGDTRKEMDERFYVNLSGASGGTIADSQGVGTILNDDGGSKGNGKGSNQSLSASAVDAAIDELMFSGQRKRSH